MNLILVVAEAVTMVVGSLIVATLFSWLGWSLLKLVGHPEFGIPLVLLAMLPFFDGAVGRSEFYRLVFVLMVPAAVAAWFTGIEWRKGRSSKKAGILVDEGPADVGWSYPAIISCVGQGHAPDRAQLRRVAKRIRREAFPEGKPDAALRRRISHAALTALGVDPR